MAQMMEIALAIEDYLAGRIDLDELVRLAGDDRDDARREVFFRLRGRV